MKLELKRDGASSGSKRFKYELTLGGLIGMGTVVVLGLIWVFIFGVLVGRGYQPERTMPELARIMPTPNPSASQQQVADKKDDKQQKSEVLKPEELLFFDKLKDSPDAGKDKKGGAPVATSAPATPASKHVATAPDKTPKSPAGKDVAESMSEGLGRLETPQQKAVREAAKKAEKQQQDTAREAKVAKEKEAKGKEAKQAKLAAEREEKEGRFSYVYQVASLADIQSATRYRDHVRSIGLNAEITQGEGGGKTWHRVVVHFKGKPEDTREMKAKLKSIGVDKPLLRSKLPLNQ